MGGEWLGILLVPLLVDGQMAGLAPVHLRHLRKVHVVEHVRQDDLLNLDGRRHEIEQRRVPEIVLDGARREDVDPLAQPALLGVHFLDLFLNRRDQAGVSTELLLQIGSFGERCLERQIQLGELRFFLSDVLAFLLSGRVALFSPYRLEFVAVVVVRGFGEVGVLLLAEGARLDVLQLLLEVVDLRLIGLDVLPRPCLLRLKLRQLVGIHRPRRLLQRRLRDLVFELGELPLCVLPLPIVIVPDHPHDRQEQEDAGRREHDVQKVDVVSVPDTLLFSHIRC